VLIAQTSLARVGATVSKPNTESNIEVAKLQIFNGTTEKVSEFLMACKLFIRIKMREVAVEEQIQ